ncbi:hypothetical protein F5883DRAFT_708200 [Diaporthe sp. PMI_573]|nr:hypothetical protein F5883DRAFT_708200 [Diaporthaceae sp. PMI_573]
MEYHAEVPIKISSQTHVSIQPAQNICVVFGGMLWSIVLLLRETGVVIDEVTRLFTFECGGWLTEKVPETDVCDLVQTKRQSGLGSVFDKYFHIRFKHKDIPEALLEVEEHEAKPSNYTILIKREPTASFWDSLMEIMSMTLSVDVLRMSNDTRSGDSFIRIPADLPRTQAIVLDDLPDGPLYDLWSLFAGSAPIRLGGILEDKTRAHALLSAHTAIIPLPGNSNPLSQIDQYNVSDRRYSALVRTFSRRLLQKYGVMSSRGEIGIPKVVKVTLTSWPGTCEIRDIDHLLRALREAFPNVLVRAVDLAAMPMAAQLTVVQSTDVLVGVHGAGLSHSMFMREGQGAVVELQPADLSTTQHQGRYKNLAATLGQKYFSVKTEVDSLGQGGSGEADVEQSLGGDTLNQIEIELARRGTELSLGAGEFVAQVGRAIEALVV